jgi:hypothetical protein
MFSGNGRDLTGRELVLASKRGPWAFVLPVSAVIVVLALAVLGVIYAEQRLTDDPRFDALMSEKQVLEERADGLSRKLERAMLDLEIGAVTQSELERQIAVLNEQLKQLKEELEFLKSAGESG